MLRTTWLPADGFCRVMVRVLALAGAACCGLLASGSHAQSAIGPEIALEGATDLRERGLSWSDGKAALTVSGTLPVTYDLALDVKASTLRGSARHGGADVGLSFAPRYRVMSGGWGFSAGVRGNLFADRSSLNYVELTGGIDYTIGPARLDAGIDFAPTQDAIGGWNLHVEARASAGIPGTPLTVYGGVGHTAGQSNDRERAWRLRPGGDYSDYHLGIEHSRANMTFGLRYWDTSISAGEVNQAVPYYDRHYGARLLAYARISS